MKPPRVRLDRLQVISWHRSRAKLPKVAGYKVLRDFRIKKENSAAYERVCHLTHTTSGTTVKWQHHRRTAYVREWRIGWEAGDGSEIRPSDVLPILKHCHFARPTLVELALDFDESSGVDRQFVRQHAKFGKSRRRKDRGGPGQLRYGARKSAKLVRCYDKPEVQSYRVELEMHSRFINGRTPRWSPSSDSEEQILCNVSCLAFRIVPKHLEFVRFDWDAVRRYLRRRFGSQGTAILAEARRLARISLSLTRRFLRRHGVNNVHRFLVPMKLNRSVEEALTAWAFAFQDDLGTLYHRSERKSGHALRSKAKNHR